MKWITGWRAIAFVLGSAISCVAVSETVTVSGEWLQGSVLFGKTSPTAEVKFLGHKVPLTENGEFVLGLDRDAPESVDLEVKTDVGEWRQTYAVSQREYNVQRVEGVPSQTVKPDPEHLKRIRREGRMVKMARKPITDRVDFLEDFHWPTLGRISGVYGSQRYYNGSPGRPHYGVDVAVPTGTLVAAPIGGKVTLAHTDMFFSGGTLIIDHGHGLSSSFLHLSKILVQKGDEVKQGDSIAEVGSTGRATGPHLDWRMNWRNQRVDPQLLVPPMDEAQRHVTQNTE